MIALIDATAPRSDELVVTTLGKRYLQARARAGSMALMMFALMVLGTLLGTFKAHTASAKAFTPYLVAAMIPICGITALFIRRNQLRAPNLLRSIVRDGQAHRATITNHRKRPGNLEVLDLTWDGGRARVDLYNVELAGREDVTILVKDGRIAAAVAGVGTFLAVNTTP
jgi:hypothetical protein